MKVFSKLLLWHDYAGAWPTNGPATLGPRADPLTTPEVIKPEWFFYVMFRWLKLFSGTAAVLNSVEPNRASS